MGLLVKKHISGNFCNSDASFVAPQAFYCYQLQLFKETLCFLAQYGARKGLEIAIFWKPHDFGDGNSGIELVIVSVWKFTIEVQSGVCNFQANALMSRQISEERESGR